MIKTTNTKMNRRAFCATFWTLILSATSIAAPVASAKDSDARLRTPLTGAAVAGQPANGHAEFRVDSGKNRARLNVEVEDVNLAEGTTLTVMVDHNGAKTNVGQIKLDAVHSGELELNSEDGDLVPAVQKGDIVIVMNGSAAILSGVF